MMVEEGEGGKKLAPFAIGMCLAEAGWLTNARSIVSHMCLYCDGMEACSGSD